MNPAYLSLANHLWQSTLFTGIAGLLTLALGNNRARVRHWVWLVASWKFLIPFSVLISLGGQIHWRTVPQTAQSSLSLVMDEVSQPFTVPVASLLPMSAPPPVARPIPALLWTIWACGFLGISGSWWIRWRRIRAAVRAGSPVHLEIPIRVVSSTWPFEPGVFGVFRPVVLLPEGILDRLTAAQLKGVISHELCHVHHRDNLMAAIHMFVETVFWFHPLVWWIGKRMVEERERACDEEVLQLGSEPRVYAEGILNVCKLYVESPLACMSGVTGPDLKRRIEVIMANRVGNRLNRAKKLLLAGAGIVVLAGPVAIGVSHATAMRAQSQAMSVPNTVANREAGTATSSAPIDAAPQSTSPPPVPPAPVQPAKPQQGSSAMHSTEKALAFDAASIKLYSGGGGGGRNGGIGSNPPRAGGGGLRFMPGRIVSAPIGVTARKVILEAFHLTQYQLSGGPSWLDSDRFDLEAEAEGANENQLRLMLQTLLAERFKLVIHREAKEMPVYHLVVGKSGAKLHEWQEGDPMPSFGSDGRPKFIDRGTMQRLADTLSGGPDVGRPVLDKTGLPGAYVFYVVWDEGEEFLPAMQQQLGLKLESQKGPVDCIVIDRIEKPNAN